MLQIILTLIIIATGIGGFFLAFYIRHKKTKNERMICPLDGDCAPVIHSSYSRFLGIPVELLGMLYYATIILAYILFLAFPQLTHSSAVFLVIAISTAALFFSLYLTFIQIFSLRQLCSWCLISAGLCVVIFVSAISSSDYGLLPLLIKYKTLLLIGHLVGVALGVGGATITDVLFFRFLKDFRISEFEAGVLNTISQVIWFALTILVVTGLGLYAPQAEILNESSKFLVKMVVVAVIIINGAALNLLVAPKLVNISFGERHEHEAGELLRLRKLAYALGGISITSWYTTLVLGSLRSVPLSFYVLLSIYIALIGLAVLGGLIMNRFSHKIHG